MISKKIIGASMIFISLCSALVFGRPKKNGIKIDSRGLKIPYEVLKKTDGGIKFAKKELITDLVTEIGYGHDKLEGLWLLDEHTICVANDNDFALIEKDNKLNQKILPGTNNPEDDVVYSVKF